MSTKERDGCTPFDMDKGPSIILNSGSVSNHSLSNVNQYGKYDLTYTVGKYNATFVELQRICEDLIKSSKIDPDVRLPWFIDETTNMAHIKASSKEKPPVVDAENRRVNAKNVLAGAFCKVNVRPFSYKRVEVSEYRNPITFELVKEATTRTGLSLMLNGVKLYGTEEKPEGLF